MILLVGTNPGAAFERAGWGSGPGSIPEPDSRESGWQTA